ncbi:hypothetical protein LTI14_08705 [Nesterenkonia sp. YGD6]|uniref:ATP-grasp fold amidoligase family protein n=1 Tax=Nesterenkonia sp. YGD6 TaxID=2901231 RepID=UPI001F4CA83A|nr:ATP-grasp fold amidoligase family protein [Nesterenkonia sp. YGD6]MCH8563291.1 hypothetical protein [Nesterenkonia sp. YGD6]
MTSNRHLKTIKRLLRFVPDQPYIQLYYFAKFRKFANLRKPSTFNEKLQWMKINYRVPEYFDLVDKYEVKRRVADVIGEAHIIPTLAVYDTQDDIDFDALPDAFVLKCTHDSEGVVVVEDKSRIDRPEIRKGLKRALSQNFYHIGREPHYRDLQPRIIAEPFLVDDSSGQLIDYKFFCFGGHVKAVLLASERRTGDVQFDYFDETFSAIDHIQSPSNLASPPPKPQRYADMLRMARDLSRGHPHVRVDLYEVNGKVYFGELTFYPVSGFVSFSTPEWDRVWGDWLTLPSPVKPI